MTIRFGSIQFQSPRCVWTKFFSISLSGIFNASKFKCPTMQYGPLNVSLQFRSRPHVRNWKLTNVPSLFSSSLRYPISILYPTKKQKKKESFKKKVSRCIIRRQCAAASIWYDVIISLIHLDSPGSPLPASSFLNAFLPYQHQWKTKLKLPLSRFPNLFLL